MQKLCRTYPYGQEFDNHDRWINLSSSTIGVLALNIEMVSIL